MSIPSGTKFHGVASSVDTVDKGSALIDSLREAYTIEDFAAYFTAPYQGWARYDDTVYTSASKLTIPADTEIVAPNNAGNIIRSPQNYDFYDSSTQKILGLNENDVYIFTFAFNVQAPNANQTHLDWRLVGSGDISRVAGVIPFHKGNEVPQAEQIVAQYYTDAGFVANGAQLKFTADGGNVQIWDMIYFIQRTQGYGG